MTQRNTPERREMLAARAKDQRNRTPGFTPMHRKPLRFTGKVWNPAGQKRAAR